MSGEKIGMTGLEAFDTRPFITILTNTYTAYQRGYIDAIAVQLQNRGYGTVVVAGRELYPEVGLDEPVYHNANRIYSVARGYDTAGYVMLSNCIGHNLGAGPKLEEFVRGFTHVPVISIGADLPSASSICTRNRSGMQSLMRHLTADPSRRHFVFIRGRHNDKDSLERERVFREVLVEQGIEVDERRMLTGNYVAIDAHAALDELLSRPPDERPAIDAVVAANDEMALAAVRVLNKHRYRVPEDVIVSGFDDSPVAADSAPPLTSVSQPVQEMVMAAVDMLVASLADPRSTAPRLTRYFGGKLRVRGSTLSTPPSIHRTLAIDPEAEIAVSTFVDAFIDRHPLIVRDGGESGHELLLAAVVESLGPCPDAFDAIVDEIEREDSIGHRDLSWWRDFEHIFSDLALEMSRFEQFAPRLETVLVMERRLRRFTWSMKTARHFDFERGTLLLARMKTMLGTCNDMVDLWRVLDTYFGLYRVPRAFVVLYTSFGESVDCTARLRYVYARGRRTAADSRLFESKNLLPETRLRALGQGTLVLCPLYCDRRQFGYLLIDMEGVNELNLEYLSYAISQVLRRCRREPVFDGT